MAVIVVEETPKKKKKQQPDKFIVMYRENRGNKFTYTCTLLKSSMNGGAIRLLFRFQLQLLV